MDDSNKLYYFMKKIRMVEEAIGEHYSEREMHTPIHLYNGQEAVAVGVCTCLCKEDSVFSNHRSHGHYIAKGGDLKGLIAELYNKNTGCCKGKGGSMHLCDPSVSFQLTSSIVAGSVSLATGWAYAEMMRENSNVVVSFLGDAASEEGNVYESVCFAKLHRLPIVYICENNRYSICTPLAKREPTQNISDKFSNILYSSIIDGNDIMTVKKEMKKVLEHARNGEGPSFIECKTYRLKDHHNVTDGIEKGYRTLEEIKDWLSKDPIIRYEEFLFNQGVLDMNAKQDIENRIKKEIDDAFDFAKQSELPKSKELEDGIWSE